MADLDITSVDLSAGLKLKNLVVPPMEIEVVYKNPPSDLIKAVKADRVIVQKLAGAVFDALKKARSDFAAAAQELDASYTKKPPEDMKEAEDRAHTLTVVCKQIAEVQKGVAVKAAADEWKTQAKKNKELTKYDGLFAVRLSLGVVGVAASVTHSVMSFGASSAVAIVSVAKTVVAMAKDIHNHCREMASTEKDIIDTDEVLAKTWVDTTKSAPKVARELATALGVPFVKSVGGLGNLLTEYDAKNARRDKLAEGLYAKAKELMKKIDETSKKAGPEMRKKLDGLGKKVTDLLDKVGEIVASSKLCDGFAKTYRARLDIYRKMEGKGLGGTAKATGVAVLAAGAAATADTIVSIAQALA